jgi:hypothetical protein
MVKSFLWEPIGIMDVESGICSQVTGFIMCIGTFSAHSRKKDLQVESEQLCMFWYSYAPYGYAHISVRMVGLVLCSIMPVFSVCLSVQLYFKLLSLL